MNEESLNLQIKSNYKIKTAQILSSALIAVALKSGMPVYAAETVSISNEESNFEQGSLITEIENTHTVTVFDEIYVGMEVISGHTSANSEVSLTLVDNSEYTGLADESGQFKISVPVIEAVSELTARVYSQSGTLLYEGKVNVLPNETTLPPKTENTEILAELGEESIHEEDTTLIQIESETEIVEIVDQMESNVEKIFLNEVTGSEAEINPSLLNNATITEISDYENREQLALSNPISLSVYSTSVIEGTNYYYVKAGDNLNTIATTFSTTKEQLAIWNSEITSFDNIYV
jgi:hypothetical protein